jgi:hypothetical protein
MFATVDDLEARLRLTLVPHLAEAVLQGASDEIMSACPGWQLFETTSTVTLRGTGGQALVLPRPPVSAVHTVTIGGVETSGWTLETSLVDGRRTDRLIRGAGGWVGDVEVTYTHGFNDDNRPVVLREVCLKLAARMWVNPEQVMQKRRADYSASYGSSAVEVSGLTRWELRKLAGNGLRQTSR